jgi:hypothetical protein
MEALCWWRNTIPELGMHSLEAFVHCEHIGFFSSHFSFRCRQVRLGYCQKGVVVKGELGVPSGS